ncbi:MAG: uracil-DNA glycosylase family protein [Pyrinomonadaceae bacterium]
MGINTTEFTDLIADVREQVKYLRELGVEALDIEIENLDLKGENLRGTAPPPSIANSRSEISNFRSEIPNLRVDSTKPDEPRAPGSRLASLPTLSSLSKRPEPLTSKVSEKISVNPAAVDSGSIVKDESKSFAGLKSNLPVPGETIEQIRAEIGPDCMRCKLSALGRSKVVNSTGNFNADLMFVGEAPGADEDEQGFPFVGRAGKLLTDIMMAIGFSRDDVFIGNINRCRPPDNRAPEPDETIACKPFLKREIAVVRPKVIVVLGATAAQNLLETKVPIGKLRGQFHDYLGTKVMPTFHPAYLLRDPHKKREVWEDMKKVRDLLSEK